MKHFVAIENVEQTEMKLQQLAEKAAKFGADFHWSKGQPEEVKDEFGYHVVVPFETDGMVKRNGDWQVLARLEHTEEGNMVLLLNEAELKDEWKTMKAHCDNCGKSGQNVTYIISDGQEELQVGADCLKTYTGIVPRLVSLQKIAEETFEEGFDAPATTCDIIRALALAERVQNEQGYVKSEEDNSNKLQMQQRFATEEFTEEELAAAKSMADELMNIEDDFLHNVQLMIKLGVAAARMFGFVAYAPCYLKRYHEEQEKKQQNQSTSEYVGEVGKRYDFSIKEAELMRVIDGYYGCTFMYKFVTMSDEVLVWFGSTTIDAENCHAIKATVKSHEEYDGVKQTIVTRVKAL